VPKLIFHQHKAFLITHTFQTLQTKTYNLTKNQFLRIILLPSFHQHQISSIKLRAKSMLSRAGALYEHQNVAHKSLPVQACQQQEENVPARHSPRKPY